MPEVVRADTDVHVGHKAKWNPFHQTSYAAGQSTVFVNGEPVIRKGDKTLCGDPAVGASGSVFAAGAPIHRKGDATGGHGSGRSNFGGNSAKTGSGDVFAG